MHPIVVLETEYDSESICASNSAPVSTIKNIHEKCHQINDLKFNRVSLLAVSHYYLSSQNI